MRRKSLVRILQKGLSHVFPTTPEKPKSDFSSVSKVACVAADPGGGVTTLYKVHWYVPPHRVGFLGRFGLTVPFQMRKKEREICEFEMDLKNFIVCTLI